MNELYEKPEVEIVDFQASDMIMDIGTGLSDGYEWD